MKWDLTYLFETEEEFLASVEKMKGYVEKLAGFKGRLHEEEALVEYLIISRDFEEALGRTYQYASLKSDLNKKDIAALTNLNNCHMILYTYSEACSFQDPEILAMGKEKVMGIIDRHPEIEEFRFMCVKLFDQNAHVLDSKSEELLSYYAPLTSAGRELYSSLAVADGKGEKVTLSNGNEVVVTGGNYRALIQDTNSAEDRKIIFEAVYKVFDTHKNTFANIYKTVLDADKATFKARNYSSSLEAHLDRNNIPTSVYHTLVEVASTCNDSLKKYLKLRKEVLGLDKYHTYDRFLTLAKSDKKYSYEDSKELFFEAIKWLPEDFKEKAREVLAPGFVDVYEGEGKRSGAYSSSMANLHPFILLNHDNTLDSAFTVAHEAGHSIHSMYAAENQPTMLQNYTIFVAEIASTFNEHALLDYFLKSDDATKDEKIMVIEKAIDSIMSTFYRQTLFAEYELIAHEMNELGKPINHEVLSKIMVDLYKKYYDLDIEEELVKKFVWAYIPHLFYTPFYVYQYATSFAASFKLYKDVKEGLPGAFDRYIGLLSSGGSKYPMEQAKEAGVDFTKKETFMAVVERMDYLLKELEELLK